MKVILTQDVEKLGDSHDLVEVAEGYARNYLLPRSLALPATKSALANLDNMKRVSERRIARLRGAAEEQAKQLEGKTVVIEARTGENGRLFGSVTTADIAAALKEQFGIEIDRKQIQLEESIRSAGEYSVPIALHRDVKPGIALRVGDLSLLPAAAVENSGDNEVAQAA
jgi:large subunit ribosomal protein L9